MAARPASPADYRLGFDLDQPPRVEEPGDDDAGRRGAHVSEHLTVRSPDVVDVVG